ncbi:hypothetical protein JNUCC64_26395 [Streptomyces sp. JNUCC 64]
MGWTVLYIAFGVVALWLLGEVLLQYKARLRWRLLAFCGFLGVVVGVVIPSVLVIGVGAIAFAIGQTYVTMSFRQGFSTGWAIGGRPGASKRRRTGGEERHEPVLQVSGVEETAVIGAVPFDGPDVPHPSDADFAAAPTMVGPLFDTDDTGRGQGADPFDAFGHGAPGSGPAVHAAGPMPDDTGRYGVYGDPEPPREPSVFGQDAHPGYAAHPAQDHGYDQGQGQYAAYADPYPAAPGYDGQDPYAQPGYGQDPYAPGGYQETPPGGVWVPQQRATADGTGYDDPGPQPYPYPSSDQGGYGPGHDEQRHQPYSY